jgi:integrase
MKAGGYREKGKGLYEFRVRLKDPLTGQSVRRSTTWRGSKREVGGALSKWVADEMQKVKVDPTDRTLSWLIAKWIDMQAATHSSSTIRTYRGYVKMWIDPSDEDPHRLGRLPIDQLTSGHLRELHSQMAAAGRRPSTVHQVHAIIRGALTYAIEREWVDRNVAAVRKAPPLPPSTVVACTDAELARLLSSAGEPGSDLWTAIALGAALGRRLGQLCTIQHSGIDFDDRAVLLRPTRKSPKVTRLPIDDLTAGVLTTRLEWQHHRWERVYGLVAPTRPGQRVGMHPRELIADPYLLSFVSDGTEPNPDSYTRRFTTLRDRLGYEHVHFHCLRHWCATTLINLGVPLPVVAERLGHSSAAVTARIYAHVIAGRHTEAAEKLGQAIPFADSFKRLAQLGVPSTKEKEG